MNTVTASYRTLSSLGPEVFSIWVGFQFLWVGLRPVFYHFAEGTESKFHPSILLGNSWASLPTQLKPRIRSLVLVLSKYQMHVHPMGLYCYEGDRESLGPIGELRSGFSLASSELASRCTEITVDPVIGDTLLSSTAWF